MNRNEGCLIKILKLILGKNSSFCKLLYVLNENLEAMCSVANKYSIENAVGNAVAYIKNKEAERRKI